MKVLIMGFDGYLGWPLTIRLMANGHDVIGVDNLYTRNAVNEVGSTSALKILTPTQRKIEAESIFNGTLQIKNFSVAEFNPKRISDVRDTKIYKLINDEMPDAIVHFAEQRSAPYSMRNWWHAAYTMNNNIISTMNLIYAWKVIKEETGKDIHIVKMGTMGEYGTPNFDIPESHYVKALINGRRDIIKTPKKAGSWYHQSKAHDTDNMGLANSMWGLTATNIMQGPVYGTRTKEITKESLYTRFDFDETWGTVLNRYCVQAVLNMPLTPYGKGGQTRAFLSLEDSVESLKRLIENPPKNGEFRIVNQFTETYSVMQLAEIVKEVGNEIGLNVSIKSINNPRIEADTHYYNPERKILPELGIIGPTRDIKSEIHIILDDLSKEKERLQRYMRVIEPKTSWKSSGVIVSNETKKRSKQ